MMNEVSLQAVAQKTETIPSLLENCPTGVIPVEGNLAIESHIDVSDASGILSQNADTCNKSMSAAMSAETSAAGSIQRKWNASGYWSIYNKKRKG